MNKKSSKFSPEVRERAVRLVHEQRSEHPPRRKRVRTTIPDYWLSCCAKHK